MHNNLHKIILSVILVCSTITAAWADGWKLTETKVYGAGGYWENGQKVRIDCSYKNGQFQYERKITANNKMMVYSTKAVFVEPQQTYAAGEDIAVNIVFTQKGEKQGYSPYARVTVMSQNPNWTNGKGASNKIPASGTVDGQATDASGRSTVAPSETKTLTAKAPSSGSQMAIVYSCNGMDVVYLYDWDGAVIAQNKEVTQEIASTYEQPDYEETTMAEEVAMEEEMTVEERETSEVETPMEEEMPQEEEVAFEEQVNEEDNDVETYEEEEETYEEEQMELDDQESKPFVKLIIIGVVALLLIVLIIFVFKKKGNGNKAIEGEAETEMGTEQGQGMFCPNCGEPCETGERFCQNCGNKLFSLAMLVVASLLASCGSTENISSNNHTDRVEVSVSKSKTTNLLKDTNTKGVKLFTLSDIDSKSLTQGEINQLDALAKEIKAMGNAQVSVIGHSDNIGSSEVNEAVSVKRARLVGDYLKKKGVTNITTSGESYNRPVAGNDTAAGRAKNRRVEVYVSTIGKYNPYK